MKKNQKTLIWTFCTEGSPPSYLLGTMHVSDAKAFAFEAIMKAKILECKAFATEFDLDQADANAVNAAMLLPEGVTLSQILPPKLYEKTQRVLLKTTGADISNFNHFKPLIFTNIFVGSVLSNDRLQALDDTLWQFARENGRILRGIETFEEQIEILKKLPLDGQIKGLRDLISHFSATRRELLRTTRWFEQAEIEKLYKAARRSMKGNRRLMIFDRNQKMAQRIAALVAENGSVCAAIGAGHLWGERGVLNLLRRQGFVVKPVSV